ncbi:MAG: hypothetical protein Ct9H300mP16_17630 [Pseudomonadota bacterium]|nr:MAG: hypothetical protein Ct9H300mP16_17630 [Pseudomonadota bacterium]
MYQDFELCYDIPTHHRLWDFARGVGRVLNRGLTDCGVQASGKPYIVNDLSCNATRPDAKVSRLIGTMYAMAW